MAFEIQPCQGPDFPELIQVYHAAFAEHPVGGHLMSGVPDEIRNSYDLQHHRKTFEERHLNGAKYFKLVERSTG